MDPKWLEWTVRLQAIAQNGLTFAHDPFDVERYESVRQVAAEIAAWCSGADLKHVMDLFSSETGYATPKVDVRGAVFRDDAILLVKERQDGLWTLPGGWVDVGESPSESVVREVWEESGYSTRAVKLLALLDRNKHDHPPLAYHVYKVFIHCELKEHSAQPSDDAAQANLETDGAGFFSEDSIPELSLTRTTPGQIARLFEHLRHPEWPADFD